MSALTTLRKALSRMLFGRQATWWGSALPRTRRDYAADVGDGMSSSVIAAPVLWVARTLPEAPIAVERDGEIERDHPMARLLRRPNGYYSGHVLEMALAIDLVSNGNAYMLKVRNRMRGPVELWYVPWWMMAPKWPDDGSAYISHYEYSPFGVPMRVEVEDVVHLRFGIDPRNVRLGLSELHSLLREVFTDDEAAAFTATILGNAGVPGLAVFPATPDVTMSEQDKRDTKEYLKHAYSGDRRGEPLVMTAPMKVEQFGFNPQQLDLAKLREIPEERVCAVIGIPAAVVGFGSGLAQTKVGATMSEMREMAYESCIIPLQRLITADLDEQLLPDFESRPDACRTVFDLSGVRVLQEDQNRLAMRWDTMVRGGWAKVSEARAAMRLEVEPEHEIYLRPMGAEVVPAGLSPEEQMASRAPAPAEEPTEDEETPEEEKPPSGNGKAHALFAVPAKASRAEAARYRRHQAREARKLSSAFAGELVTALRALGEQAADLWREALRTTYPGLRADDMPELKELGDGEIEILVRAVMAKLSIRGFDYAPHYVRVGLSTVRGLNDAFGLGVNLSEPLEAMLVREGGRRLGLVDMAQQAQESLFEAIAEGRSLGHGPGELALDIRDTIPRGPWSTPSIRAEVIARTETMHAQRYASLEAYRSSDTVTAVQLFDAQLGEDRSDPECIARNGRIVSFDEAEQAMAEEHPNGTLSFAPVVGRGR